jgi:protein ImuB
MRWACVLLPQLALDGVLRQRADADAPLALIAGTPQRRVLQAVNLAARALGLRPGQSLNAARVLSQDFVTVEYDPVEIERWHRFLAAWAYRFSSQVSLHYPRVLLMEVESSLNLFGPWPRFEARLREELTALGFRHRIVVAPNPIAARVLANVHDGLSVGTEALHETLGQMPIERVGLSREVFTAFARMGLRTLRQVLALPRDTVARRFPAEVLLHLDRLLGSRPVALECYVPPDEFDVRIELNFEVESHQALLFPLRRLTSDLAAFLAGRDSGVQRFALHLQHRNLADTLVQIGLLSAEREQAMLFELARGRLEQLQLPAPVQAVRLVARDLPTFVPEHKQLFDDRPQQTLPWEQLRERLRARLGEESVQGLGLHADHRPEYGWQSDNTSAPLFLLAGALRPGWLLRQPLPFTEGIGRILAGPECIESGWWDGDDVRRHYYLIETRSGQRAWVYRSAGTAEHFQLHGWFA